MNYKTKLLNDNLSTKIFFLKKNIKKYKYIMFTKSNIVYPPKDENYNEIFLCNNNKKNCNPPSKILEDKIKFKNSTSNLLVEFILFIFFIV